MRHETVLVHFVFCLLLLEAVAISRADHIRFKSGKEFDVTINSYSNGAFVVQHDGQVQVAPASKVETIEFDVSNITEAVTSAPAETPEEAPPPVYTPPPTPSQPAAGLSPTSYLADVKTDDMMGSYSIKQVMTEPLRFRAKFIKLTFSRRAPVQQVSEKEFRTTIYDDTYNGIYVIFPPEALMYFRNVRETVGVYEADKKYGLFGFLYLPEDIRKCDTKYWIYNLTGLFIPVGKAATRHMGTNAIEYGW